MKSDVSIHTKALRRVGLAVGGLMVLWAIAWVALPSLFKSQFEARMTNVLGRQVTVGQVDIKPWSLELKLENVAVSYADAIGSTPQLSVKGIYVDMAVQSFFRLAPVMDAIQIDEPRLHIKHLGNGRYDVDDVLARFSQASDASHAQPLQFALYNLVLADGEVILNDSALGKWHHLKSLAIKLPFLSNFDSSREVTVQPQLAFVLNGAQFDTAAQSTPFTDSRKTQARFKLKDLDLVPYMRYLPASLPVRLESAVLNADIQLSFEQTKRASISLSGLVSASQVKVAVANPKASLGQDLLAFESLSVQLTDVRPLERHMQLGHVDWVSPRVALQRNAQGVVNWQSLFEPPKAAHEISKKRAPAVVDESNREEKDPIQAPWVVALTKVNILNGELYWTDDTTPQPARLTVRALDVSARDLQWPMAQSVPFEGNAVVGSAALSFNGNGTEKAANLTVKLTDAPLSLAAPYLASVMTPSLSGLLNFDLGLTWQAAQSPQASAQLVAQFPSLSLDKLELRQTAVKPGGSAQLASVTQVKLAQVTVDVMRQTMTLGQVRVTQPKTKLVRLGDGHWMFEDWLEPVSRKTLPISTSTMTRGVPGTAPVPWRLAINDLSVEGGVFGYTDDATSKPVAFDVSGVSLKAKNFATFGSKPWEWRLAARMHHGQTESGNLTGRGTAALSPLVLQADLNAQRLPLHALEPYLASALNIELLRADTSFKGQIKLSKQAAGMDLQVRGDVKLEDFRADTLAQTQPFKPAEELLSWKDLSLEGLNVVLAPGGAPSVDVAQTALSDFYARLTLSETGRLNLQDVLTSPPSGVPAVQVAPVAAVNAIENVAYSDYSSSTSDQNDQKKPDTSRTHFGPLSLTHGRIDFSDRFIKPNYSAHLTELTGKLSAFSSQTANGDVQLADLELRGRAEGTATLELLGQVNPLANPLALDIVGHVRDLELAPLSPYTARYAGYGIERGKLSMDVQYKVQPDGQLTASNNIMLNQLKFGDEVPGAANSLPVKLAVALLADRHGVIDINLPVSGSLNDPQFRVGPMVFKLIVNLIVKAVTAPFSLLASAFGGGGDELSMVSFAPGSATLTPEARAALDKVGKALLERPALKMTVVGTASLEVEREAYKRGQLQALVSAEKRRAQPTAGGTTSTEGVSTQDYPVFLKAVYKRADFPKPRNFIGLVKDLPSSEMEALLLANLSATEQGMQELAIKRGVVVRDYLEGMKLPLERLFLGAAKAVPPESRWRPRAELKLATQ